jgi:hypothetical protein
LALATGHFFDETFLGAARDLVAIAEDREHWAVESFDRLPGLPVVGELGLSGVVASSWVK